MADKRKMEGEAQRARISRIANKAMAIIHGDSPTKPKPPEIAVLDDATEVSSFGSKSVLGTSFVHVQQDKHQKNEASAGSVGLRADDEPKKAFLAADTQACNGQVILKTHDPKIFELGLRLQLSHHKERVDVETAAKVEVIESKSAAKREVIQAETAAKREVVQAELASSTNKMKSETFLRIYESCLSPGEAPPKEVITTVRPMVVSTPEISFQNLIVGDAGIAKRGLLGSSASGGDLF